MQHNKNNFLNNLNWARLFQKNSLYMYLSENLWVLDCLVCTSLWLLHKVTVFKKPQLAAKHWS